MSFKIVGDSCLDWNRELLDTGKVSFVPLTVEVGEISVIDDMTFDQAAFLKLVRESSDVAHSACPSPSAYKEAYAGAEERKGLLYHFITASERILQQCMCGKRHVL